MSLKIELAERRLVPDPLIRLGIRQLITGRLRDESAGGLDIQDIRYQQRLQMLRDSAVALHTEEANDQHYEVASDFFRLCLGKHLKYSACYWTSDTADLDAAEHNMLSLYEERAGLRNGQRILDLGCGWGSLSLFLAERHPDSQITAVSNSRSQKAFIVREAASRGITNVEVITADVNELRLSEPFDRIVSVEMFEHVRNYPLLLNRIKGWLKPDGRLFIHIFCHRNLLYPYETEGDDNWMGRYFFTGGLMPAADTLLHFQDDVRILDRWLLSGRHYQKTARAWLDKLDANRKAISQALEPTYGTEEAQRWLQRWRMFFMACEELFGYQQGREWLVGHYLFAPRHSAGC